ncbi:hypothetical protein SCUCBS95973_003555 [Sporothrix curviconia]|uniref:Uncharacterized protein n=1 Tax=Sporothrix curviconia TaxID=1260050 RepID=A0ABP0BGJ3_9PEZI
MLPLEDGMVLFCWSTAVMALRPIYQENSPGALFVQVDLEKRDPFMFVSRPSSLFSKKDSSVVDGDVYRLSTSDSELYPLPSPQLLEMHLCAAKMLNASVHPEGLKLVFAGLDPTRALDEKSAAYKDYQNAKQLPTRRARNETALWQRYLAYAARESIITFEQTLEWNKAISFGEYLEDKWWADLQSNGDEEWCILPKPEVKRVK